jgi:pimeloyl-ACP methyl ester carboxylesterase
VCGRWVGALGTSTVPLAVINGPWDPISGRHVADAVRDRLPKVKLTVLPDLIGHYPQVEAPDLVLNAYHDFRRKL